MKLDTKAIVKIAATALFLLLCALLPSRFAHSGSIDVPNEPSPPTTASVRLTDFSARAALFNEKFDFSNNSIDGISFDQGEIDKKTQLACEERLQYILSNLTVDIGGQIETESFGINFYTVYDGDGGYMRIMQYYNGWYGDWYNWFTFAIDVDTQELYYLYISSRCLQSHKRYAESLPYFASFVEFMSLYTGYEFIDGAESYDADGHTMLFCTFGEDEQNIVYSYNINGWGYYNEQEPSMLFDYKIICKTDADFTSTFEIYDADLIQQSVENDTTN